jgi:hypothetical protein
MSGTRPPAMTADQIHQRRSRSPAKDCSMYVRTLEGPSLKPVTPAAAEATPPIIASFVQTAAGHSAPAAKATRGATPIEKMAPIAHVIAQAVRAISDADSSCSLLAYESSDAAAFGDGKFWLAPSTSIPVPITPRGSNNSSMLRQHTGDHFAMLKANDPTSHSYRFGPMRNCDAGQTRQPAISMHLLRRRSIIAHCLTRSLSSGCSKKPMFSAREPENSWASCITARTSDR